jgi:secondary thiamine-phosphate synthase enzyme
VRDLIITTSTRQEMVDITDNIEPLVPDTGYGFLHLIALHTTCALTTIDSDPGIDLDLFDFLNGIIPQLKWRHPHNPAHAPAHLLSSIIGPTFVVPFSDGRLLLGSWQRIILVELDGPRERKIEVSQIQGG